MITKKVTIINQSEFASFLKEKLGFKGKVDIKFNIKHRTEGMYNDQSKIPYVESVTITEE